MDKLTTQKVWTQLSEDLICGNCKAVRLLIWEKEKHSESPQQAKSQGDIWYALHCDYFKRRIEHPDLLQRCGAHQTPQPRTITMEEIIE